jgi:hypothetical protein
MPPKPRTADHARMGDIFRLAPCLTSEELLVLLALADYGKRIFPSQAALAAKTRLHISTVKRTLASLRTKRIVQSQGWGKALTYRLDLAQGERGGSLTQSEVVAQPERGGRSQGARDPNYQTNHQPNLSPADAGTGGWGISDQVRNRIRQRDPRADFDAQERVCRRVMAQHGLTMPEAQWAWGVFCDVWARTGNAAYDTLSKVTIDLTGARDVRALVLHRIKAVAA